MKQKICFISTHAHPINSNVKRELQRNYPECEIIWIDLVKYIKQDKKLMILNGLMTLIEYFPQLILHRLLFKEVFFKTRFIYSTIKKRIEGLMPENDVKFTIQTNSLFDTSIEGLPHFVYTDHTHLANLNYPVFNRKKLLPKWRLAIEQEIYQKASMVMTYGSNIAISLKDDYNMPAGKIACVGVGGSLKLNGNITSPNYNSRNILFVGIDWVRKGGPQLLQVFKEIKSVIPEVKLTIIGASPRIDESNCNVVGRIPVEELNKFYSDASVFCLPTLQEPFGVVFLEAMHYKLPVVATNIGGIPDMVKHGYNGYLSEPFDLDSLRSQLTELLQDASKCKIFGENGYRMVNENYTWEIVGKKMKEKIDETTGR